MKWLSIIFWIKCLSIILLVTICIGIICILSILLHNSLFHYECLKSEDCGINLECSRGFFGNSCTCIGGYEKDGRNCSDIDECSKKIHKCSQNAECHNIEGSYICTCLDGYSGDGWNCENNDECLMNTHNCSESAGCINTEGHYICICFDGYTGNGQYCIDIDECSSKTHICCSNAVCQNTEGSYTCTCLDGCIGNEHLFCTLKADLGIFIILVFTASLSIYCIYRQGYNCWKTIVVVAILVCIVLLLLRALFIYLDSNEFLDDKYCGKNGICSKKSSGNIYICKVGYERSGQYCVDINECSKTHNCSKNAECHNIEGNYTCNCLHGYTGNGLDCIDVDECLEKTHKCGKNAKCLNTVGSYNCTCLDGYTRKGSVCEDVDECLKKTHNCSKNAECHNTEGSYACNCLHGYTGNGLDCIDIDECSSKDFHNCSKNAKCQNTDGSYICTICLHGYTLIGQYCIGKIPDNYFGTIFITAIILEILVICIIKEGNYVRKGILGVVLIILCISVGGAIFYPHDEVKILQPINYQFHSSKSGSNKPKQKETTILKSVDIEYDGSLSTWEDDGLKINFKSDALPPNVSSNVVHISTITSSTAFNFPENLELVSELYDIKSEHTFQKPVTLEIKHYGIKVNPDYMYFIYSNDTEPPYNFYVMDNGDFDSTLGILETSSLQIIAIVKSKLFGSTYYSIHLYSDDLNSFRQTNIWTVYLFFVKRSSILNSRVKDFVHMELKRDMAISATVNVELLNNISDISVKWESINAGVDVEPTTNLIFKRDIIDTYEFETPPYEGFRIDNKNSTTEHPKVKFTFIGVKDSEKHSISFVATRNGICETYSTNKLPETRSTNKLPKISTCTKIESPSSLEKVLEGISSFSQHMMKVCLYLKIADTTCNSMSKEMNAFKISQAYMAQSEGCWEYIVVLICRDFLDLKLGKRIKEEYGIPEKVYNDYCNAFTDEV